jgi:hypothetical protein
MKEFTETTTERHGKGTIVERAAVMGRKDP